MSIIKDTYVYKGTQVFYYNENAHGKFTQLGDILKEEHGISLDFSIEDIEGEKYVISYFDFKEKRDMTNVKTLKDHLGLYQEEADLLLDYQNIVKKPIVLSRITKKFELNYILIDFILKTIKRMRYRYEHINVDKIQLLVSTSMTIDKIIEYITPAVNSIKNINNQIIEINYPTKVISKLRENEIKVDDFKNKLLYNKKMK